MTDAVSDIRLHVPRVEEHLEIGRELDGPDAHVRGVPRWTRAGRVEARETEAGEDAGALRGGLVWG